MENSGLMAPIMPTPTPVTDMRRVMRMAQGSASAWGELYERHRSALIRFCGNYTRDPQLAEEWAHETFVVLKEKAGTFRAGAELKPWLYRIARNVCLQSLRRKRELNWSDSVAARQPLTFDSCPSALSRLAAAELSDRALRMIAELSEVERTVFILRHVEGLKCAEIAQVVDAPLATVKSRLYRAMQLLAERGS
jgi:RNA polymerase sigma-70 factor (ECF subfamily)